MKYIYKDYFQKSNAFLYPLLGFVKKIPMSPIQTYIGWREKDIHFEDEKLIVLYRKDDPNFETFRNTRIICHPCFKEEVSMSEEVQAFVFDMKKYTTDWDSFLLGRYSQLSEKTKEQIINYHDKHSVEGKYITTYLYPNAFYSLYSDLLGVHINTLMKVVELCDHYDGEREEVSSYKP